MSYLSHATSTFIIKIQRSYYRMVWAALAFMDHVPVKNGLPCTFRVMRVSGTIRKAEEEAIRRAKQLILAAKHAAASVDPGILKPLPVTPEETRGQEDDHMLDVEDHSDSDDQG